MPVSDRPTFHRGNNGENPQGTCLLVSFRQPGYLKLFLPVVVWGCLLGSARAGPEGSGSSATAPSSASGSTPARDRPTPPYLAVVTAAQVTVRAGPSDQFPDTGTLQAGMQVWVDHEESNGWLAVQDPPHTLRTISWVPMQFINFDKSRPIPQNVVVDEAGAPLRPGKIGLAEPLPVQRTRVPGGTILLVIGPPVQRDGRTWYPVASPPGDFRYLPKHAVEAQGGTAWGFQVREPTPVPPSASSPAHTLTSATTTSTASSATGSVPTRASSVQHPLWQQAEAAEQAGRYEEAERLFFDLARLMNEQGTNHDIANLCYTRIHALREKRRQASASSTTPAPENLPSASGGSMGAISHPWPKEASPPTGSSPSPGTLPPSETTARWYGPGRLVRSAIALDGRKTYALEAHPGVPIVYVVAGAAGDLERYLNTSVQVYGPAQSRRGLSYPYVTAQAVSPVAR